MKIELLYFKGCPHYLPTLELVNEVVRDLRVEADISFLEVHTSDDAKRLRFLGSPTIHVNGEDVEPLARVRVDYGMSCRLYGSSGIPPRHLVEAALREGSVT